jgi:hypothetical protein
MDSLTHVLWVQIALLCITGISLLSTAILLILNSQQRNRIDALMATVKFLNRPKTLAETGGNPQIQNTGQVYGQ